MKALLINNSKIKMPRIFLQNWIDCVTKELFKKKLLTKRNKEFEITLVFLDKIPARDLNLKYRNKNYATDVLSFQSINIEDTFGDLVLCPEVIKRQAMEHQLTFQQELGYMVLHGILHLLGFDHEKSKKDAKIMFSLQDEIFEKIIEGSWIS